MDSPYGYWYEALASVARALRPDASDAITATKAIRKAVLLPEEAAAHYLVQMDDSGVLLSVLTNRGRLVRVRFAGEAVEHLAVRAAHVHFLGGEFAGVSSGTTEVWGLDAVVYRFLLDTLPEPIALTLPQAPPNSVGGMEEIAFAQALLEAISS